MNALETVSIRKFFPQDREDVRRISCETAFLSLRREEIFSDDEILADALTLYHTDHEPESCFVAVKENRVIGYIIGTKDVSRMERASGNKILPRLLWKALRRGIFLHSVNWKFFLYCSKSAVKKEFVMPDLSKEYPAMLHINIESGHRGEGVGNNLVKAYEAYLMQQGVRGVHFGTISDSAKDFFVKMGFAILFQGKRSYLVPYLGKEINFYVFGKRL